MSTIRVDNFGNRAGTSSISADTMLQGTAKAWLNLNGTGTIALLDSFNIASTTDIGVGVYNFGFSTALPNANYARTYGSMDATFTNTEVNGRNATTVTVNTFGAQSYRVDTGGFVDNTEVSVSVMGDSA